MSFGLLPDSQTERDCVRAAHARRQRPAEQDLEGRDGHVAQIFERVFGAEVPGGVIIGRLLPDVGRR